MTAETASAQTDMSEQSWTAPVQLTVPLQWTCAAAASHPVVLEVIHAEDDATPLHAAIRRDLARTAPSHDANRVPQEAIPDGPARATVLRGGRVFTADPARPWAEAVAVLGDRIVAVGSDNDVLPWADSGAEIIELAGRAVIPGLNDAHMHHTPDPSGVRLPLDPLMDPELDELRAAVAKAVAANPAGTWICGTMGAVLTNEPRLDRFCLDVLAPSHPVILLGMSNHTNVLNSMAMELLGIGEHDPDPVGGTYGRLKNSSLLNGRINEYASWCPQYAFAAMATLDQGADSIRALSDECLRFGITTVQNMSWTPVDRYVQMAVKADVPLRIRVIRFPASGVTGRETDRPAAGTSERVTLDGTKWILDGTFVERGAAHRGTYHDDPGATGRLNFEQADVAAMLEESVVFNDQLLLHALGTEAIEAVVSAVRDHPGENDWSQRRLRVEHGDGMTPQQAAQLAEHRVTVVQNPVHFFFAALYSQRYGADHAYTPYASLFAAGLRLGIGSDGPLNPFLGLLCAVTHPARPEEAVDIQTAVRAYTHGSAWAQQREHELGLLAPGYLADIAVLSQDIFSVDPEALPATESVLTMIGGVICHRTGAC
ncbi:amidohydrolase [Streptomyces antimycoticus]|uniref:amidohydrolase n=1 Tax=Streptomyces antimycoticus TaxID=68175 RepID=UPI0037D430A2